MEIIKEALEKYAGPMIDKKRAEMLKLRQVSLNCSIQQNIKVKEDMYLITVVGAEPGIVIKGFKDFKERCQKKLAS